MKLRQSSYRILESILGVRYYLSISTLPIGNWFEIHRTNDKSLVKRNNYLFELLFIALIIGFSFISVAIASFFIIFGALYIYNEKKVTEAIYTQIYDEFIKRIGLNKEFLDWLKTSKRIAVLRCECAIEPSPINLSHLEIELKKLEKKNELKQVEYNHIIAKISKSQGYRIDSKKVTVLEFYSYING